MCTQEFEVVGLNDERTAYEVEEFLRGVQNVSDANADFLNDRIEVVYDETKVDEEVVLDYIERAGCKPSDRITGVVDHIKAKFRKI